MKIEVKNKTNIYIDDIHVADFTLEKNLPNNIGYEQMCDEISFLTMMCVPIIELDCDKKNMLTNYLKICLYDKVRNMNKQTSPRSSVIVDIADNVYITPDSYHN